MDIYLLNYKPLATFLQQGAFLHIFILSSAVYQCAMLDRLSHRWHSSRCGTGRIQRHSALWHRPWLACFVQHRLVCQNPDNFSDDMMTIYFHLVFLAGKYTTCLSGKQISESFFQFPFCILRPYSLIIIGRSCFQI